jgi:hypothetical protein
MTWPERRPLAIEAVVPVVWAAVDRPPSDQTHFRREQLLGLMAG